MANTFAHLPHTPRNHFLLCLYGAVYRLVNHIRRLSEVGGDPLERMLERYPFLGGYFDELRRYLPAGIGWDEALGWMREEMAAWEAASTVRLPLLVLAEHTALTLDHRVALMIVGLVEEDSRFGTLFSRLQEPLPHRRPCLELVGQLMLDDGFGSADPWQTCRPLIQAGLLEVANRDAPRSEWVLRVPSMLWEAARGEPDAHPVPWCRPHPAARFGTFEALILPAGLLVKLRQVPHLLTLDQANAFILRGSPGSERLEVAGAIARALNRRVIEVEGASMSSEREWELLGPLCAMADAIPVIHWDLAPGETAEVPRLAGYRGPVGVLLGLEGGLSGPPVEKAVTFTVPGAQAEERRRCWQEALQGQPVEDLETIVERFHMPTGYIRQAARIAAAQATLEGRGSLRLEDVRGASRTLNRQVLDTLASRIESDGAWDRLVVSPATGTRLRELERRCRHRERLLTRLSSSYSGSTRGVRALFAGTSGTGKTFAARILAAELGLDLYRVDLSAVVNKYIGETEKNLHRVLSRAEELDVVLLLDEGDSLLGRRTEVRSANDRYANLETNYLLQRLEHYEGIVVVTTNAAEQIDRAFQRRMDVVVQFVAPQAQERWQIWQLHLPPDHRIEPAWLEAVAVRCALTGGQIRNAAMHATLLALDDGSETVSRRHLEAALQSEYRKAGATFPLQESARPDRPGGGMAAFIDTLHQ